MTSVFTDWVRPWYPGVVDAYSGRIEGHLFPDCEDLLRVQPDPQEGAGWLDPDAGDVCTTCLNRDPEDDE